MPTGLERSICHQLVAEFNTIYKKVSKSARDVSDQVTGITTSLGAITTFSDTSTITTQVDTLSSQVTDVLPEVDDNILDSLTGIIGGCGFMLGNPALSSPTMLINKCRHGLFSYVDDLLSLASGSIPEFGVARLIGALEDLIGSAPGIGRSGGIGLDMSRLDSIIGCVNSIGGAEFSSKISTLTDNASGLYTSLGIDGDPASETYGALDIQAIYSQAGLSADEITKVNSALSSVTSAKSSINDTMTSAMEKIKTL